MCEEHGGVAHRLEQAAHNHLVGGSIPPTPTIEFIQKSTSDEVLFCMRHINSIFYLLRTHPPFMM